MIVGVRWLQARIRARIGWHSGAHREGFDELSVRHRPEFDGAVV